MKLPFTVGCICGAIRYRMFSRANGNSEHCRDCQRVSGSAFLAGFIVPLNAVAIVGKLNTTMLSEIAATSSVRGFCPTWFSKYLYSKAGNGDLAQHYSRESR